MLDNVNSLGGLYQLALWVIFNVTNIFDLTTNVGLVYRHGAWSQDW